jgi:hypothetical protein
VLTWVKLQKSSGNKESSRGDDAFLLSGTAFHMDLGFILHGPKTITNNKKGTLKTTKTQMAQLQYLTMENTYLAVTLKYHQEECCSHLLRVLLPSQNLFTANIV